MNTVNLSKNRDKEKKLAKTQTKQKISKYVLYSFLVLYILISVYPFLWAFYVSFANPNTLPSLGLFPNVKDFTTANYSSLFTNPLTGEFFGTWLSNSVLYSIANASINAFFNFLAGYSLARIKFKAKKAIVWYILAALMVPVQATQVPQLTILIRLGFINAETPTLLWFVGIMTTGMTSGVLIFMVRQFYLNQSPSIEEAGLIDGLGRFQVFTKVSLRSMLPLLATQWTMVFIGSWNNFIMFTLWANGMPERMNLMSAFTLMAQTRFGNDGQGRALAAANISIIPVLSVYVLSLKYQRKVMVDGEK